MNANPTQPTNGEPCADPADKWELILFVAGNNPKTQQVMRQLVQICEEHLAGRYRVVMSDILENPEQAFAFDIIATPTLLRAHPEPKRKIIGDLSQIGKVLSALEIEPGTID
jgi:circadian clock protein KaiB